MKMKATMLVIALGALGLFQASAQPNSPTQPVSATMTQQTPFAQQMPKLVTPLNLPPETEITAINRAGNISSRPWTQIAEHEDETSGFPNNQTPEPKFNLLSVSFGSKH